MKLTFKLSLALSLAILAVLAVNGVIRVRRELAIFAEDSRADSRSMGRAVAGSAARIWARSGEAEALDVVRAANERESQVHIRWVWLDEPVGPFAPELPRAALDPVLAGEAFSTSWSHRGHDEALYTYVPVIVPGERRAAIELRGSLAVEHRHVRNSIRQAAISTLLLVVICSAIAVGLGALLVGRPVKSLVEQARRIGDGDLSSRLELRQRDEIGELARAMNGMSERLVVARAQVERETDAKLAALEQLRHADRLTTVGKLASGIAHEVGTPLNVITGHAQLITDEYPTSSGAHENAVIVAEQAHRVTAIIRQLLDFARPRTPRRERQDILPIVRQVVSLLGPLAQKRSVELRVDDVDAHVWARVDAGQLQQVITNLIVNAVQATPNGTSVGLSVAVVGAVPPAGTAERTGGWVRITVEDAGSGIPAEVLPHIFEPFFTTKDTGQGTGLGLAVAYGMVKEHGGWLDVTTTEGKGSRFSVYLPSEEPA